MVSAHLPGETVLEADYPILCLPEVFVTMSETPQTGVSEIFRDDSKALQLPKILLNHQGNSV